MKYLYIPCVFLLLLSSVVRAQSELPADDSFGDQDVQDEQEENYYSPFPVTEQWMESMLIGEDAEDGDSEMGCGPEAANCAGTEELNENE